MNYESMSDFEINKAVADLLEVSVAFDEFVFGNDEREVIYLCERDGLDSIIPVGEFNPCNNPSDAWPVIIENNISINHETARYNASALVYDVKYERGFNIFVFNSEMGDTSSRAALRAAMIVFLMMNEKTKSNKGDVE